MDASDLYRRSDGKVTSFTYDPQPCLASYMSIDSHPLGEYGFKEFVSAAAQEMIWVSCKLLRNSGQEIH